MSIYISFNRCNLSFACLHESKICRAEVWLVQREDWWNSSANDETVNIQNGTIYAYWNVSWMPLLVCFCYICMVGTCLYGRYLNTSCFHQWALAGGQVHLLTANIYLGFGGVLCLMVILMCLLILVVVSTPSRAWARTGSQTPARGPPSFSPHTSSSAATPTGFVHKSQTVSIVGMSGQLKRCNESWFGSLQSGQFAAGWLAGSILCR